MQPIGIIRTTSVGEHTWIIPVKFDKNPISGFRENVSVKMLTHNRCHLMEDDRQNRVTIAQGELKNICQT